MSTKVLDESGVIYLWSKVKEKTNEINDTIQNIESEVNSKFENLEEITDTIDLKIKNVDEKTDNIAESVQNIESEVNSKFERLDELTNTIDSKIEEVDSKIEEFDSKTVGMEESIQNLENELNSKFESLDELTNTIDSKIEEVNGSMSEFDSKIEEILDTVSEVDNYTDAINNIQNLAGDNAKAISKLNADEETNGSVRYLIEKSADELKTLIDTKASIDHVTSNTESISNNRDDISALNVLISTLNADESIMGSIDYKIKTAIDNINFPEFDTDEIDNLQNQINSNATNIAGLDSEIDNVNERLHILEGEETEEGSVKYTVINEIAKVVADAPEDLDTLKEIAEYIAADKTGAAEILSKISDIEGTVNTHEGLIGSTASELENEIARATEAEGSLNTRITALENGADDGTLAALIATNASDIATNKTSIEAHTSSINLLNSDKETEGSVKYEVETAKSELIDDATTYNTFGKVETELELISTKATNTASELENEIARATEAEGSLNTRITALENGADDGILAALIATNASDIATNKTSIEAHTSSINLLNSDKETEGSVKYEVETAKSELIDDATTYNTFRKVEEYIDSQSNSIATITSNLESEITRATDAEGSLNTRITALENAGSDQSFIKNVTDDGAGFVEAGVMEGVATISINTVDVELATESPLVNGVATALSAKKYIDKVKDEWGATNDELIDRIEATESFITDNIISFEEIDALDELIIE